MRIFIGTFIVAAVFHLNAFAQKAEIVGDIDSLINAKNNQKAYTLIKERITTFLSAKNIDTLDSYVGYLGKTATAIKNETAAKAEINALLQKVKTAFPYHKSIIAIYFEASSYYSLAGNNDLAYQTLTDLENYFKTQPAVISNDLSSIESNKGDFANRSGKYALASSHYRRSIELLKATSNPDQQTMYFANNSMGIVMWYASKLDSAVYYFNKAVDALNKMENTPLNRHFRVALVQNNIAGCYNVMGKTAQAIEMFENVIEHNKQFIASPEANPKKESAKRNQYASVDNLAKVYLELGDFSKAHDLLYYSYQQKLAAFGDKSPELYKSLIFLGTVYYNQRNYSKASEFLQDALKRINASGETNTSWSAEAYTLLALSNRELKNSSEAAKYFEEASRVYELVYGEQYDDLYLNYLGDVAMFYADNDNASLALSTISKGLNFVVKSQGENSLQSVLQLRNLANVNFKLKKYNETITASEKALTILNGLIAESKTTMDSVKIEMEKPRLILLQARSKYQTLSTPKDTASVSAILQELYGAKEALDKRKAILFDEKDISALMTGNGELLDFIKQLNYELYQSTGKINYLDKMIGLQEAGTYARIRSRMDKQKAIRFSNVPESVVNKETALKEAIQLALKGSGPQHEKITKYIAALNNWNSYKQQLSKQYPIYYNMRYAGKEKSLQEMCADIPEGITVIRYFFSEENLFALVATKKNQQLVALQSENIAEKIALLNDAKTSPEKTGETAHALYLQLWKPLEKELTGTRIMIIPDNVLYNLSFEMLSPVATNSHGSLAAACLLNKYAIGYHYSLLAVAPASAHTKMKGNFVGFSPGFTDEQKKIYSTSIQKDSMRIDNTYLNLLPLPFTTSLTKKIKNIFGGQLYLNDASTPSVFRAEAGNHNIIHIGTHAESNNDHPEFSRLIFAKDPQKSTAENSLYLFDIYNCNLSSDLSVLTACESGKPGYQDGEGMISMAHAFNYAGSQSILTGLWKIDEQSSAAITDEFYKNLQNGLSKDESLRLAKLKYIKDNEGRMLAPHYWAGLVIMGDTSPIELKPNYSKWYWIAGITGLLIAGIAFFWNKRKNKTTA